MSYQLHHLHTLAIWQYHASHVPPADSPWEVGAHLIAALDNAFILGYPFLIMSFLGWAPGVTLFILFGVLSFYCNCLLCQLHTHGGTRHVRYRDLAKAVFGESYVVAVLCCAVLCCAVHASCSTRVDMQ